MQEATDLAKRSKDIRDVAVALQREERSGNKGRNWRKNVRRVERVSLFLRSNAKVFAFDLRCFEGQFGAEVVVALAGSKKGRIWRKNVRRVERVSVSVVSLSVRLCGRIFQSEISGAHVSTLR